MANKLVVSRILHDNREFQSKQQTVDDEMPETKEKIYTEKQM